MRKLIVFAALAALSCGLRVHALGEAAETQPSPPAATAETPAPPPAPQAVQPTLTFETIRLKAGIVLAGHIIGYSADSIVMKVYDVERAYPVSAIQEIKTTLNDPGFLRAVVGAALKSDNAALAISIGQRDEDLTKTVLRYPKFLATVAEVSSADEALDKLLADQARLKAQQEQILRQIDVVDANITRSQQIIANPYYYEMANVTRAVVCPTCNGTGVIWWTPMPPRPLGDTAPADPDSYRRRPRPCPTCSGTGQITTTNLEQVRRTKDVNAEAANIVGYRAQHDRLDKALANVERDLAAGDTGVKAARGHLANAEARLKEICGQMWEKYFAANAGPK